MKRITQLLITSCTFAVVISMQAGCAAPAKVTKAPAYGPGIVALSGKVTETMNSGGYTYVCLEKDGKKTWAAVPTINVKVGDELQLAPGAEMVGFRSESLHRTFDSIFFSGGLANANSAPTPAAKRPMDEKADPYEKPILAGKVVETMDSGGYTYICLEKDGKKGWSAVPITQVKVGQELELEPGIDMVNFSSNTLKRTFVNIHFSAGIKGAAAEQPALPANHPAVKQDGKAAAAQQPALPANHPALKQDAKVNGGAATASKEVMPPMTGKVAETMEAGGYTYINLEKDGKKRWVAVPAMKVAVGDQVALLPGPVMNNFNSRGLNRTFDKIIFSSGPATR